MSYDVEFSKFLLNILKFIVRSTAKSTYYKELLFLFFKIFYTLIVHRHLANIVDILWSRPVWGGGGGQLPIELVKFL